MQPAQNPANPINIYYYLIEDVSTHLIPGLFDRKL